MPDGSALGALTDKLKKRIDRRDVAVFAMSFLLAFGIHLYSFTNKLLNQDDIFELFGGGTLLGSGRWLLNPVMKLTGRVSMPVVYGLAGSVLLALTILTVIRVLRVRRLLTAAVVALAMAAHPSVACTWAYMFTAPAYFFAMLLAVLGVSLIRRPGWGSFALGAALVGMSMGCYQAYLALASTLAVLALMADIWDGELRGEWKHLVWTCLRSLAGLVAGLVIYFAVLKLCLWVTGMELVSYAGLDSMTDVTLGMMLKRVALAYKRFFTFPESPAFLAVHRSFPAFLTAGAVLSLLSAVYLAARRRIWTSVLLPVVFLALLCVFPLAADLSYVMAEEYAVHWLMLYPTVFLWVVPALAADRMELPEKGTFKRAAACASALVLLAVTAANGYEGALIDNKVYLEMELSRQSAQNYLTRLFTKIEEQEDYTLETKVVLIGTASMPSKIPDEHLTGIFVGSGLLNIYSRSLLETYYHGFSHGRVSPQETEALKATAEFAAMPSYPAEGSIRTIDGIITVKLSG